jgi:sensor histidine kinase YesM
VQIYDVIQDDALNYWIATDNGIYKYDCYSYTRVTCEGVQGLSVFGFVKNNSGSIYCYNLNHQVLRIKGGVCKLFYELKKEEWSTDMYLSITAQNELMVITKTALLFTEDGLPVPCARPARNYYGFPFLTAGGQTISHIVDSDSLLVYENGRFKRVALDNDGETVKGVLKFFTLSEHTYAISTTEKTIYVFDPQNYSLRLKSPAPEQPEGFQRFYNENDQLWVASNISGVSVLSGDKTLNLSATYYPQYFISDVYRDMEGNLLFSTFNHGILIIPNPAIPDVLPIAGNRSVVSIHTDEQLGMLMGTVTGELLAYKNGNYSTLSNSGSRPLQSVFSWNEFPFVLFDDGKIKAMNKKTGATFVLTSGSLKDATLADSVTLFIALNIGVCKITLKENDQFECERIEALQMRCYAIEYSPADKLVYVATAAGVKILDNKLKTSDVLLGTKPVFANDIAMHEGTIYLATKEGIVPCHNGRTAGTVKIIVQGNAVETMKLDVQEDKFNTITTAGFAMFNGKGETVMQLNRSHGFLTNRIYDFEINSDTIWICHAKGIQRLMVKDFRAPVAKPRISISGVMVNDHAVSSLLVGETFTSEERKFKFLLSSPTLRNKENIRYHYQLIGYDKTWLVAEFNDHEIVYNALAPGDYTFSVKAENKGVFSETVNYSFTIAAPVYLRWWFLLATGFFFVLAVAFLYRYQLNLQQRKARIINELNLSKLTAIQSQMNPHFIFNSLNSIQDLVLKGDVDNSYSFITKFSNLIRRTLQYSDQEFIEFEQELKLLELYLSLEKLRFGDELKFEINTGNVEGILIPPMLIQPFIENALVHGLLHREGEKKLSIRFRLEETLICIIEDNGVGRARAKEIKTRQRSEHESFSGHAIKKRFSILSSRFKEALGFKYEDLTENGSPSGTRVTLSIPVKHKY